MSTTLDPTEPLDPIDRAIAECVAFDPYFLAKTRGATADEISALERAIGRPCGKLHRRYLERLGVSAGWLDFGAFDPSIAALVPAYERTRGVVPAGWELFAVATDLPFEDAYLVAQPGGPWQAVEAYNSRIGCDFDDLAGDLGTSMAGSLPELICRQPLARRQAELAQLACYGRLDPDPAVLSQFAAIAQAQGLAPMWFSNARCSAAGDRQTLALAQLAPGQAVLVTIAGDDPTTFAALGAAMLATLKLRPTEPPPPPPPLWPPRRPAPAG